MKLETRAKMSAIHKGRIVSDETRQKMRLAATGRVVSAETREKLRIANIGMDMSRLHTPEANAKRVESRKGWSMPESQKQSLSAARKGVPTGRKMSDENKEMLRNLNTGRKHSAEVKNKLSVLATGRKHTPEARAKLQASNARLNKERRKSIQCSNGMVFSFSGEAQDWLRNNGFPTAQKTNIVSCCTGRLKSAYGFTWSFATLPESNVLPKE